MSNFQIALIVIGLIAIGLVLLWNWWQNNNAEKNQRRRFAENDRDVLMTQDQSEPFHYTTDNGSGAAIKPVPDDQASTSFIPDAETIEQVLGGQHSEGAPSKPISAQADAASAGNASAIPPHLRARQNHAPEEQSAAAVQPAEAPSPSPAPVVQAAETAQKPAADAAGSAAPEAPDTADNADNEPDPHTEVVIDLPFQQPVLGREIQEEVLKYPAANDKAIRYFVVSNDGISHLAISPNEQYVAIQMAVLLANRNGPLGKIQWSRAGMIADELASRFDANIEMPDFRTFEDKARRLDEKSAQLDTQINITLVPRNPQPTDRVLKLARSNAFVDYRNTLAWRNHDNAACFFLLFDGVSIGQYDRPEVERVNFLIDVPNSPPNQHAFGKMVAAARDMAKSLDAIIVDDQGQALEGNDIQEEIDMQLHQLYQEMEKAGLPAGSERNARVFS